VPVDIKKIPTGGYSSATVNVTTGARVTSSNISVNELGNKSMNKTADDEKMLINDLSGKSSPNSLEMHMSDKNADNEADNTENEESGDDENGQKKTKGPNFRGSRLLYTFLNTTQF
jgi:hypothetical protein